MEEKEDDEATVEEEEEDEEVVEEDDEEVTTAIGIALFVSASNVSVKNEPLLSSAADTALGVAAAVTVKSTVSVCVDAPYTVTSWNL